MIGETIRATISWADDGAIQKTLDPTRGEGFGLLERMEAGWAIRIPDGADARLGGEPVDLGALALEPSGERILPLGLDGAGAEVEMAGFRFSVVSASTR